MATEVHLRGRIKDNHKGDARMILTRRIKILCVCNKGNVRSVATKYCLNRRGYWDVLTVGSSVVSGDTFDMLCDWSNLILLAKPKHGRNIKERNRKKVDKYFTIGNDTWGTPLNLELEEIINKKLDELCL